MMLKRWKSAFGTAILALAAVGPVQAQSAQTDIAVTRAQIQSDRQTIVADNMHLTDAQATAFWPLYREYRGELAKLGDRSVKLVTDYATSYANLTDAKAATMTTEFLSIQKDTLQTKEKYLPKFIGILPAKLVMRFLQIENKLDTIVMLDAVTGIPLAK